MELVEGAKESDMSRRQRIYRMKQRMENGGKNRG